MTTESANSETPSHRDLLIQAKVQQKQDLQDSTNYSESLVKTINAIVKVNSTANGPNCPFLLDKISTVHELDREIDRQLKRDIAGNCEKLVLAKKSLSREYMRARKALQVEQNKEDRVDILQRRAEQQDQELRILEHTLALIKQSRAEREG